jgi:hypothetical protein
MESRNRFTSGNATGTKCTPPEYSGELDRVVLLDKSESLNQIQNYTKTVLTEVKVAIKLSPTALFATRSFMRVIHVLQYNLLLKPRR